MNAHINVLAAVDLDPGTTAVIDRALREASMRPGAVLTIIYVMSYSDVYEREPPADSVIPEEVSRELAERATTARKQFAKSVPGGRLPETHVVVAVGSPASEIVWQAAHLDADLLVVGSHNRTGAKRMLMGSVSEKVVRLAGCPVIVIRKKAHDPSIKVPEIEPVCPECASVRAKTAGERLWCARHSEHHVRAHTYSSAGRSDDLHAWESMTGR